MKYFVTIKLGKAELIEIVHADLAARAKTIALVNIQPLLEKWYEKVMDIAVVSFHSLGYKACHCDPSITYRHSKYYYHGREVGLSSDFIDGFGFAYVKIEKENYYNPEGYL